MKTIPSKSEFSSLIEKEAYAVGFDAVGITAFSSRPEDDARLDQWIDEKRHGEMQYLENFKQRRMRFNQAFPEAQSVIVLGVNYFSKDAERPLDLQLAGRIARYARGQDYHLVIRQRHEKLIERLKKIIPELRAFSCVDTQPLQERPAAVLAGLGFYGKNTMLLSKQFGPWLFLSEMITNIDLAETIENPGTCGTCTHCQVQCPTGALDQDYRMDARRCISYLTIEYKGIIPIEMRPFIKDWIFGCDECLTVCPFTTKQKETQWEELKPQAGSGMWMDFDRLFRVKSNREYEKAFQGTSLLRAGRKQMMRNACIVLGNSGRQEAFPYLLQALSDPSPLVRRHAAWGLGRIGGIQGEQALSKHFKLDTDAGVLEEIEMALKRFKPEK